MWDFPFDWNKKREEELKEIKDVLQLIEPSKDVDHLFKPFLKKLSDSHLNKQASTGKANT